MAMTIAQKIIAAHLVAGDMTVVSMARAYDPNSASSQFFIMHKDAPHLDGQYAAFGKVVSGMEVVDEIASIPTDYSDRPKIAVRIKTVTLV